ncbi:MAG: hypothetical protein SNJ63_00300 [Sphingomonadaceae bacterium]
MAKQMKLQVNIALNGNQTPSGWNIGSAYSQGNTDPPSSNVVDPEGNITLTNMAKTSEYDNKVEVEFIIARNNVVDMNGNPAHVRFISDKQGAVSITPVSSGVFGSYDENSDGSRFSLTDEDNDGSTYTYCLSVVCSQQGARTGTIVPLDPRIVNRQEN